MGKQRLSLPTYKYIIKQQPKETIEPAAKGCVETRGRSPRLKPGSRRLPLKLGSEATD